MKIDDDVTRVKLDRRTWPQRRRNKVTRRRTSVGERRERRRASRRDRSVDDVTVSVHGVAVYVALRRLASDGA